MTSVVHAVIQQLTLTGQMDIAQSMIQLA